MSHRKKPREPRILLPTITPEQDRADAKLAFAGFWIVLLGILAVNFILERVRP